MASRTGEIRDSVLHKRWTLVCDSENPGGPARLIETPRLGGPAGNRADKQPIIRTGSRIRVEEHTPVLDAALEGLAMETAATGEILRVRLTVGGRVVRAFAVAPGRATLAFAPEGWR